MNFEFLAISFGYALIAMLCAVILKYTLNFKAAGHYDADDELCDGNLAVGIRRAGAYLGAGIAITGAFSGVANDNLLMDFAVTFGYGVLAVAFMVSSLVLTDKAVLPGVSNLAQIQQGNLSVGIVEFSMLISTGIMAQASIYGDGGSLLSSLGYFAVGQISLVAVALMAEKVFTRQNDILKNIENGEVASGLYLGGKLVAYSLILKAAIVGQSVGTDFVTLATEFAFLALSGIVMLYVLELLLDGLILTKVKIRDVLSENQIARAAILAGSKIGLAFVLSNGVL